MTHTTDDLLDNIDIDNLADDLTGRGDGLRASKPTTVDGLTQYVWRMARFHAGYDTSMPVTCAWWLQDYLDENGIDAKVSGVTDDAGTELTSELEEVTEAVLITLGESPGVAADVWHRAGAI